ncbi:MAG TPA: urease accessory protein UreD [Hyphomicrobiales bacterium]|nr:urease accessory protein UreD [Hyphomicrobiales bacterium]
MTMSDVASPSEAPARQRAEGRIALVVGRAGVSHIAEAGSARVRLPRHHGPGIEAVLINTAGGIAGGDRFAVAVEAGSEADLAVSTAAAEKIYRGEQEPAELAIELSVAAGARLAWLPQETILFDRARLHRRLDAEVAAEGALVLHEAVVFGRLARGERLAAATFADRWRVRRAGRLVYADTLRLEGDVAELLDRPAAMGEARALATVLYVAPDAEARLDEARTYLAAAESECGASAWNGMLLARFLAADGAVLRRDAARLLIGLRGRPLPRVWNG